MRLSKSNGRRLFVSFHRDRVERKGATYCAWGRGSYLSVAWRVRQARLLFDDAGRWIDRAAVCAALAELLFDDVGTGRLPWKAAGTR